MNRHQALIIEIATWMTLEDFQSWIDKFSIEYTFGNYPQDPSKRVLFLSKYDATIFDAIPQGETINILQGFRMIYDNGTEEIQITEANYMQYWEFRFLFYAKAKGTYAPEIEELI